MNGKEFFISLLTLLSTDCIIAYILYYLTKYINLKYFSSLDVVTLKQENEYLKQENSKINGSSTDFWGSSDFH